MSGLDSQHHAARLVQFASADELQGYLSKMGVLDQPEAIKQAIVKIADDFKFHETKMEDTTKQGNSVLVASGTFLSIFLVALTRMREQPGWMDVELLAGLHLNQVLGALVVLGIVAAMLAALLILRVRKIGRLSVHWLGPLFARNTNFAADAGGVEVLTFRNLSQDGRLYVMRNTFNQFLQYHGHNKTRTRILWWAQTFLSFSAVMLAIMVIKFIFQ